MDKEIIVDIIQGKLKGKHIKTNYGAEFYGFSEVPYGKPPLGIRRFMPPIPIDPWPGIHDGTKLKLIEHNFYISDTEDVLYVDIYTPTLKPIRKLPVVFVIGGYAFKMQTVQSYGPGYLTNEDVVVVYCSYRLAFLGFLSISEACAPGNCGLKDIVLALKFVQMNISAFGGDPHNITLLGYGSGAAAAHLMILSPMARGLFHKVILHSTSALCKWVISKDPIKVTMAFVKEVGLETDDPFEAVETLKTLPYKDLLEAAGRMLEKVYSINSIHVCRTIFAACIESDFEGQPAFLTQHPIVIIKSGNYDKVPIIMGNNRSETKNCVRFGVKSLSNYCDDMNKNINKIVPKEFIPDSESSQAKLIGKQLKDFYLNGAELTESTMNEYNDFLDDYNFVYFMNQTVKLHCKHTDVYYYIFDYFGWWENKKPEVLYETIGYCCELIYLFAVSNTKNKGSRSAEVTKRRMVQMWTNFFKYGQPMTDSIEDKNLFQVMWKPVQDENNLNYLNIDANFTIGCNPWGQRMAFWDQMMASTVHMRALAFINKW